MLHCYMGKKESEKVTGKVNSNYKAHRDAIKNAERQELNLILAAWQINYVFVKILNNYNKC